MTLATLRDLGPRGRPPAAGVTRRADALPRAPASAVDERPGEQDREDDEQVEGDVEVVQDAAPVGGAPTLRSPILASR
jgi:hypothetical protein